MSSSNYVIPTQYRYLRACMVCSIVQPQQKFIKEGCPNWLIALWQPTQSWVSKWQRIDGFVRGMYAVKVSGNLPEEVIIQLEDADVYYQPRDGSDTYTRE
ncbi:hypothetical protein BDZ91DRAFT_708906 [Kalaharituber pfeilii]|nr:hypothetical protein BDZ91DRAFT_708906 [Kalaharituber pfeilii]